MNNDSTQRLSSQSNDGEEKVGGLLAAASDFARGVLESIQTLAGTTSCKGVQIARLKDWAIANHCWLNKDSLGTFSDRGSENEVYASLDSKYVYKLNDFRYSDDNLTLSLSHLHTQSVISRLRVFFLGLAENRDGKVCAVLRQPFILSPTEASQDEISTELECLGFHKEDEGFYTNGNYDIFDAVPNNVLKGNDGHLYFIDTIIYESGTGGRETYNSLSPRQKNIRFHLFPFALL